MKVVLLSGGVGGARFARGLVEAVDGADLSVVGNVGDDVEVLGMSVSPDLDSIVYALAGLNDEERGWGRAGETWEALGDGLPDQFWVGVMRDAMCADDHDAAGIYVGARNGSVWASSDAGESWRQVVANLPDVLVVRAARI